MSIRGNLWKAATSRGCISTHRRAQANRTADLGSSAKTDSTANKQGYSRIISEFVRKYGFSDLREKEVRKYKHRFSTILNKIPKKNDDAATLRSDVEKLIKEAGKNPDARPSFNTLYQIVGRGHVKPGEKEFRGLVDLARRRFDLLDSPSGLRAATELVKDPRFHNNGNVSHLAPAILASVSASSTKRVPEAVTALIDHAEKHAPTYAKIEKAENYLRRFNPKMSIKEGDLSQNMLQIARSKNPAKKAAEVERKLWIAANKLHHSAKNKELDIFSGLISRNLFLRSSYSERVAEKIVELGGPHTQAGLFIMSWCLQLTRGKTGSGPGKAENMKDINDIPKAHVKTHVLKYTVERMLKYSYSFQFADTPREIRSMKIPSGESDYKPAALTRMGKALDHISLVSQSIDTVGTMLNVAQGGAYGTASALACIMAAIAAIPMVVSIAGGAMGEFQGGETAMFRQKGHLAALECARRPGSLMNREAAYRSIPSLAKNHALINYKHPDSKTAHRKAFDQTWTHLQKMSDVERVNFIRAYEWVHRYMPSA